MTRVIRSGDLSQWQTATTNTMGVVMARITECPECGSALEMVFAIWLNDVVVDTDKKPSWKGGDRALGTVVAFTPAETADDAENGIVVAEAEACYFACLDQGHKFVVDVPVEFASHWKYIGDLSFEV